VKAEKENMISKSDMDYVKKCKNINDFTAMAINFAVDSIYLVLLEENSKISL
jgi:hypothetical protein